MGEIVKSVREPQQKRSIEKKARLVAAAFRVFGAKGYYKTDTADIAREAGMATGTFYAYFKDKKDILQEAGKQCYAQVLSAIDLAACPTDDPVELQRNMKRIVEALLELDDALLSFHKELMSLAYTDSDIRADARARREELLAILTQRVKPLNGGKGCTRESLYLVVAFLQNFFLLRDDFKASAVRQKQAVELTARAMVALLVKPTKG